MNQRETVVAIELLQKHPAAKHCSTKMKGSTFTKVCSVCGVEETLYVPGLDAIRGPQDVAPGVDEMLFRFFKTFLDSHSHEKS